MLKIAALVSFFLIATYAQAVLPRHIKDASFRSDFDPGRFCTLWAAGMSCDSCGDECAAACGTRQFRACCFNYLRRKRTSGASSISKYWPPKLTEIKPEDLKKINKKTPIFTIENIPDRYVERPPNDFDTYWPDDTIDNRIGNFDF